MDEFRRFWPISPRKKVKMGGKSELVGFDFSLPAEFLNTAVDPWRWGSSAGWIVLGWTGRSPAIPIREFVHLTSTLPLLFSLHRALDELGSIYVHHNLFCSNSGFVTKSACCVDKAGSLAPCQNESPTPPARNFTACSYKPRFTLSIKCEFVSEPNKYDEFKDILS
jgi:membrane carboxypeptidase/penicillin-binding protein PbpC